MEIRRQASEDLLAAAARARPAIEAAEARGEEIVLADLPPCAIGRPVRARIAAGSGPYRRIAWCAPCADAGTCPGLRASDDGPALSRSLRPRLVPQWEYRETIARHLARLRTLEGLDDEPLATIERAVLDRIVPGGPTTPFEASIAWRGGIAYRYRFSCATGDATELVRLVPGIDVGALRELPPAANVAQILFGIEAADGQIRRAKVYAMLREGLHMVGLDLYPDGRVVHKTYRREGGPADDVRVESPHGVPKAVDRALLQSDLGWDFVTARLADRAPLDAVRSSARLVPARFSVSAIDAADVTLYYWILPD